MLQVSVHHSLWQSTFNWPQTSVIAVVSVEKKDKSPEHKRFHWQSANTKWTFSLVLQLLFEPLVLLDCLLKRRLQFWSFVLLPLSKGSSSREKSGRGEEGGRRRRSRPSGCFLWKSCKFSTRALVCSFRYARLTWAWGTPAVSSHLPMPIKPCGAGSFPVIGLVSAPTMGRNLVFQLFRSRLLDVTSAPKTTFPPAAKANRGAAAVLHRSRPTPCQKKQS